MAPHLIAESSSLLHPFAFDGGLEGGTARSPAVSSACALGIVGCLLASSGQDPLPHLALTSLYFLFAVEVEIRALRIPLSLALPCLAAVLCGIGLTESGSHVADAAIGAGVMLVLASPFFATGVLRIGTLVAAAVPAALWGATAVPAVLLTALAIGVPLCTIRRLRRGSALTTFPFITALGLAGALHPLL